MAVCHFVLAWNDICRVMNVKVPHREEGVFLSHYRAPIVKKEEFFAEKPISLKGAFHYKNLKSPMGVRDEQVNTPSGEKRYFTPKAPISGKRHF
jgi:hypothetical protein